LSQQGEDPNLAGLKRSCSKTKTKTAEAPISGISDKLPHSEGRQLAGRWECISLPMRSCDKTKTAEVPQGGISDELPHSEGQLHLEISSDILSFPMVFPYIHLS
jgi:hypothetical protein